MNAEHKPFSYLSICSGIEAATVAWHQLGWQAQGFAEIDPFACAILKHHYPQVPLHGDFTKLKEHFYGAVDLLVGGTPCQSFSVAGLRRGLDDDRGNLTLEFIRLAQAARPRWLVWENVPGVLSIDGGRTFGTFLGGLAECGYGFAYRILDAQYFGVPQRRRRVFVVGYLGDWRPAAAVLFEHESLRGDITPRGKARQGIAATLKGCTGSSDEIAHTLRGDGFDASEDGTGRGTPLIAGTVSRKWAKGSGGPAGDECQNLVTIPINTQLATRHNALGESTGLGIGDDSDPAFTLQAERGHAVAFNVTFCDANGRRKDRPGGGLYVNETEQAKTVTSGGDLSTYIAFSAKDCGADAGESAPTLRAMNHNGSHQNGGGQLAVAIPLQEVGKRTGRSADDAGIGIGIGQEGDAMFTLQAAAQHGVAAFKPGQSAQSGGIGFESELSPSLEGGGGGNNKPALLQHMAVRRLTPRECERLQGFPDDYTLIPFRGKPAADGNRYKALGNSMAVPVMRWLGERIKLIDETMDADNS